MNLQPKREQYRKATAVLAPVIDLKSKTNRDVDREDDNAHNNPLSSGNVSSIGVGGEFDWNVVNEYDPIWPNEYEKVVKELRDIRDREHDQETEMRKRRRDNTRFEDTQVIYDSIFKRQEVIRISIIYICYLILNFESMRRDVGSN